MMAMTSVLEEKQIETVVVDKTAHIFCCVIGYGLCGLVDTEDPRMADPDDTDCSMCKYEQHAMVKDLVARYGYGETQRMIDDRTVHHPTCPEAA